MKPVEMTSMMLAMADPFPIRLPSPMMFCVTSGSLLGQG